MKIEIQTVQAHTIQADCLIVGITEGSSKLPDVLAGADKELGGALTELFAGGEVSGKKKNVQIIHTFGKMAARRIMLIGLGKEADYSFEVVREAAARAVKEALKAKLTTLTFAFDLAMGTHETGHAIVEGALLANYRITSYQRDHKSAPQLTALTIISPEDAVEQVKEGARIGEAFANGTNLARDLTNLPGNYLTPTILAQKACELAERHGMEVEVLDKANMEVEGMGGLLGVSQGSAEPPKLIVIKYKGAGSWTDVLGIVGKGVTFDSGGISIKPAASMDEMKGDMGGAASVLGVLDILGTLKPAIDVVAVIPTTENMPSGTALKPGDVITAMNGKTIEILNTDAEGRLILADGLSYARKMGASRLVDMATLTGAALVALGTCTTAAITNDEMLMEEVMEAAAEAGELLWRLPTFDLYMEQIKSQIADLKNTGGRHAGTITAGLFLREFAEDTPWVHLDIAGPSWAAKADDFTPAGGTGAMVRTVATLALQMSQEDSEI
ncbi:leucyl aminopeptidase [Aneurinibacillus uraniidurans]|uniref:leucyl aminopeptidase n=1 Tax=Aneurinibacillus uraniidurans TaxID=2966586 RepID=UPI00234BAA8E|nr:leucyl aminopeptidase [Aneurinibacillus sp. B1]WCN38452.1 leucyl aminopeptidase [Aneurinibacillus sp. B1]